MMLYSGMRWQMWLGVVSLMQWVLLVTPAVGWAQQQGSPFAQLDDLFPAPSSARLATGAPGPDYWQQQVDYDIDVALDEQRKMLRGQARIHYENRSPHTLTYLWLQLDGNRFTPTADARLYRQQELGKDLEVEELQRLLAATSFDGGVKILRLVDSEQTDLAYTVVKGMLRLDLPQPLTSGAEFDFEIDWELAINPSHLVPGRTGYERFDDGNAVFCIAQWFPRLCAYTDYGGWRHKQFLQKGEFTLEFGNYDVRISVPADHIVLGTGALVNHATVMTKPQQDRLRLASESDKPVFIVTPEEARAAEQNTSSEELQTWHFQAENVRDFAFATSRKFIWDACGQKLGKRTILCMSLYPKEGQPLWDKYSTHAVAHTIEVYSRYTGIDYPYPHATAVMGVVGGGMEYPMICFNGPRPEKDGTYSEEIKRRVIGVVIHEVGHNWFPMILNSDERHWMWLDEGLNTFVQTIATRAWERNEDYEGGEPRAVVSYLNSNSHQPIMTQPDAVSDVGNNAYRKPATGLTILRETILGRELFDSAFREYCRRWAFKRPEPADLFRTLEDASGVDLDWFWRGWFYGTDTCDFEVVSLTEKQIHSGDPADDRERHQQQLTKRAPSIIQQRDAELVRRVDRFVELEDFYTNFDPHAPTEKKQKTYAEFLERLTDEERELLARDGRVYELKVKNNGTLVMPLIVELLYEDGTTEIRRFPAEIWLNNLTQASRLLFCDRPLQGVQLDPYQETSDTNPGNNRYPPRLNSEPVQLTKPKKEISNPLKDSQSPAPPADAEPAKPEANRADGSPAPSPDSPDKPRPATVPTDPASPPPPPTKDSTTP